MIVTLMFFAFKFIILAIGFYFGYKLLVKSSAEKDYKKTLGKVFGWILIVYSIILALMTCLVWVDFIQKGPHHKGICPFAHHKMHQRFMQRDKQDFYHHSPKRFKQGAKGFGHGQKSSDHGSEKHMDHEMIENDD